MLAGTIPIPEKCEACLSTVVYMKQGLQGNHTKLWTCTHTSLRIGIVSMYIHTCICKFQVQLYWVVCKGCSSLYLLGIVSCDYHMIFPMCNVGLGQFSVQLCASCVEEAPLV